ncbi:FAD-dependent monooxygenase [Pedococcus sp. KACC 23699]|uniref:FAD-dependent monooxygenase n=1 Tax=Pedococcus sp. KACC 23699 TaxID=3149228 RepID=UPI00387818EB
MPSRVATDSVLAASRAANATARCGVCLCIEPTNCEPMPWSDDRIWSELQARVGANGHELVEGPITDRAVLRFRSFVNEPMRYGNMLLAGDAAHTVPPTGAKGLNLALADVRVLAEALDRALRKGDPDALGEYTQRALVGVWKSQHLSYWMTTMLHTLPEATDFDVRRQIGESFSPPWTQPPVLPTSPRVTRGGRTAPHEPARADSGNPDRSSRTRRPRPTIKKRHHTRNEEPWLTTCTGFLRS